MQRSFSKMHGLGNDFVVFDCTREPLELSAEQSRAIADRRFGVGCDQILLVEPARDAQPTSTTASLMPTAQKLSNVATVHAALRALFV
jgi:diaminopimelate epimerase